MKLYILNYFLISGFPNESLNKALKTFMLTGC